MTTRDHYVSGGAAHPILYLFVILLAVAATHMTLASPLGGQVRNALFLTPAQQQATLTQHVVAPRHSTLPVVKRRTRGQPPECEVHVDSSGSAEAGRCLSTFGVEGLAGICQTFDRAFIGFSALCVKHVQHPEKGPVLRPGS